MLAPSSAIAWELPVEMGLMSCNYALSSSAPDASDMQNLNGGKRDIDCSFRLGLHGPNESYLGTSQFIGKADEVLGKGALMFVAKAPRSLKTRVGMMEGKYAIQALSSSGSQKPLVGENKTSIILHPLNHSYDRPTLALGRIPGFIVVLELKLKAAPA